MKRYLIIILIVLLTVSCSNQTPPETVETQIPPAIEETSEAESPTEPDTTEPQPDATITVDKGSEDVTIIFPSEVAKEANLTPETLNNMQDIKQASTLDNGSLSITMTKPNYDALVGKLKNAVEEAKTNLIGSEDTPYIKAIESNETFSKFSVTVEKTEYDKQVDMSPHILGMTSNMYQMFEGLEVKTVIEYLDETTGEQLKTFTFPTE